MKRVRRYTATVYYGSTGSSSTSEHAFTQTQADEVGAVLEEDGINVKAAERLLEKWNRRGNHGDIRYSYRLCIEDLLRE